MAARDKHDHTTKQIEAMILARKLKSGDRLPSERQLQVNTVLGEERCGRRFALCSRRA